MRDSTEHTCQLVVEGLLVFNWVCYCWSVHADNCSKLVLAFTGRGVSVSIVTISFLIAKPTPASLLSPSGLPLQKKEYSKSSRLPDSVNRVSHRAAMLMLYLASSIATSAVRLSGRLAPSRSRRVLTFHYPIVSSCLLCLLLPS